MNNPTFSIIIPTYNRAHLIDKTIKSILNQSFTDFEVIVVDDGSTDNTEEVVSAIKDKRLQYHKKNNEERAVARNYGAKLAKGEYVNFFDSDDIAYQNHLEEATIVIDLYKKPEIFHLAFDWATPDGKVFKIENNLKGNINKTLIKSNVLSCNGVFVQRNVFLKNQFNEDRSLSASEDYELWLRIASRYKIYHNPIVTSCLVDHEERSVVSINKEKLIKRKELFLKYTLGNPDINNFIGNKKNTFIANAYSYIALHLVLAKYKKDGLKYYLMALKQKPFSIFEKRSLAIIKHLLFL